MSMTVAAMLADLIGPAESRLSGGTPAKAANPAKNRTSISFPGDSGVCEGLRKVANSQPPSQKFAALRRGANRPESEHSCGSSQDSQDSQGVPGTIALNPALHAEVGDRKSDQAATLPLDSVADVTSRAMSGHGFHADAPHSRPYKLAPAEADAAHAEPWNDAACARFVARVSLFLRRGIGTTDADDLAERLHLRDVHADDRVICVECHHLAGRPGAWHCANHRAAGGGHELPAALVTTLQRCAGFTGATS